MNGVCSSRSISFFNFNIIRATPAFRVSPSHFFVDNVFWWESCLCRWKKTIQARHVYPFFYNKISSHLPHIAIVTDGSFVALLCAPQHNDAKTDVLDLQRDLHVNDFAFCEESMSLPLLVKDGESPFAQWKGSSAFFWNCVEGGPDQIVKLHVVRAEMHVPCACRTGKFGKNVVRNMMLGLVSEVTVKEQQRWVRHETGEGEMERCDTCAKNPWAVRVCDTHEKCAKYAVNALWAEKMCVQKVSVCTLPVVHTVVATTCVRNLSKTLSRKKKHSSLHGNLDKKEFSDSSSGFGTLSKFENFIIPCPSWSFLLVFVPSWLFINHCEWRLLGLWETDLPNLLIFNDAFVWTLHNCARPKKVSRTSSWNCFFLISFVDSDLLPQLMQIMAHAVARQSERLS